MYDARADGSESGAIAMPVRFYAIRNRTLRHVAEDETDINQAAVAAIPQSMPQCNNKVSVSGGCDRAFPLSISKANIESNQTPFDPTKVANILPMKTLFDIVSLGNSAAKEGCPLVHNWVQVRGHLYLFGQACGGLDQCLITDFDSRFPEDFRDICRTEQECYPSSSTYIAARREISRLLAMLGYIEDPWEALRVMIRQAGRDDIERNLPGLKVPALEAGLSPAQIRTDWVWSLDAEKGIYTAEQLQKRKEREARTGKVPGQDLATYVRQRLRASVAVFNELFDIEAIANSGLLPPQPIGDPPVYDRAGRKKVALPPKLNVQNAMLGIYPIWRAICVAGGLDLPDDPSPDDLIAPKTWKKITDLSPSLINLQSTSWTQYLARAKRQLLSAATIMPEDPNALPDRFEQMIQVQEERWHLNLLWRQMRAVGVPGIEVAGAAALLELDVWRALLQTPPEGIVPTTFRAYMIRARKILLRHAPGQTDPLRIVKHAWVYIPDHVKPALAPIRKAAEAAYLRPKDVGADWLDEIALEGFQKAAVLECLDGLPDAIRVAQAETSAAVPKPEFEAWQSLRESARSQGFITSRLGIIATPAVQAGLSPSDLNRDWILRMSADFPYKRRAKLGAALRELDAMLDNPQLSPRLYAIAMGPLPDARSPGTIDLPEGLAAELATLHDALGSAESTRREGRSVVRKIATAAVQRGLSACSLIDLLKHVEVLGFEGVILRKAQRMRVHLESDSSTASAVRSSN